VRIRRTLRGGRTTYRVSVCREARADWTAQVNIYAADGMVQETRVRRARESSTGSWEGRARVDMYGYTGPLGFTVGKLLFYPLRMLCSKRWCAPGGIRVEIQQPATGRKGAEREELRNGGLRGRRWAMGAGRWAEGGAVRGVEGQRKRAAGSRRGREGNVKKDVVGVSRRRELVATLGGR